MSGAEALAVIGIVSSILQIVEFTAQVYDRFKQLAGEVKDIPRAFQESRSILDVVSALILKTQAHASSGQLDEETCKALHHILENCQGKFKELRTIYEKAIPADGASKIERGWKAISSLGQEKKVKALTVSILEYVQLLTYHHASESATAVHVASIKEAISRMSIGATQRREPCFMVRYEKDKDFIGRADIIEEIGQRFQRRNRVSMSGIGGVGKSRIAIEYCYKYKDNHPKADVFWVHCGNKARFEAAYHEIARTLKVPGYEHSDCNPLQPLSDWLSDERNGSWLMILDNADDAEVWLGSTRKESTSPPLATFIPRGSHGSVLITTRDSQLGKHLTSTKDKPIDVLTLRPEDAEALLHSKLSEEGLTQEDAEEMTRVLDYLPLAITQAAAFLDQNDITVAQYLRLYRDGKTQTDELLEVGEYDTSRDHEIQNSVFHTWKLSFNQISKQAPLASNILSLMAMFDRQSISADLLRSKEETELDFIVAIRKLKAFSLIEEQPDVRCFSLHRLVQLSIQRWLNYKNELRRWQEIALTRLYDHYPEDEWFLNGAILETLNPHIHVILSCRFETVGANLKVARMKCILGSYARNQGHYASAFKYQSDSLSIRENYLGRHHPDTLISMNRLAAILLAQFKYDQAHGIYREVLEQRLKIFGPEHRETLHTMRGLGNAFYAQGNYLEAENLLKQTLEVQRKVFGAGDFTLALTMKTLSGVQSQLGYFSQAYDLQQKALQIYNETLGPQNPYTLSTMGLVAYLQTLQGDIYNGEKRLREVLEVQEATLGPLNRDTLASRLQLASVLSSRGKHEEAEQMARTVLKEQESVFGPEHPIALNTREQVALMLSTQGKYVEAEALAREGLSKRESSLGVNHVITLKALYNLTLVLRIAKHPDEALERRLVEEREKVLGFDHPDTLINVENLIDTLLLKGKFDAADQLMQRLPPRNRKNIEAAERQLVKAWEQKLGTDCPEALLSQRISGTETQGDIREVKLLKQMLERIRRVREYSTQHEEDNQVEGGTNHSVFHARSTAREDFARIQTVLSFRNSQLTQTWAGSR